MLSQFLYRAFYAKIHHPRVLFFRFETVAKMLGRFSQGIPFGSANLDHLEHPMVAGQRWGKPWKVTPRSLEYHQQPQQPKKKTAAKIKKKRKFHLRRKKKTSYINWSKKKIISINVPPGISLYNQPPNSSPEKRNPLNLRPASHRIASLREAPKTRHWRDW